MGEHFDFSDRLFHWVVDIEGYNMFLHLNERGKQSPLNMIGRREMPTAGRRCGSDISQVFHRNSKHAPGRVR